MTQEELDQFLELQRRVHELAMSLLKPYCEMKRRPGDPQWINEVSRVTAYEVEFDGWDGADGVGVCMPIRYLVDEEFRQQLLDEVARKEADAKEHRRLMEEKKKAEQADRDRATFERLKREYGWN